MHIQSCTVLFFKEPKWWCWSLSEQPEGLLESPTLGLDGSGSPASTGPSPLLWTFSPLLTHLLLTSFLSSSFLTCLLFSPPLSSPLLSSPLFSSLRFGFQKMYYCYLHMPLCCCITCSISSHSLSTSRLIFRPLPLNLLHPVKSSSNPSDRPVRAKATLIIWRPYFIVSGLCLL